MTAKTSTDRWKALDFAAPPGDAAEPEYAVASVKWLKRIDVLAEPYSGGFQNRPLHLRVAGSSTRTRRLDAGPRPHHRSSPRNDPPGRHLHRARKGLVRYRASDRSRRQLHRRRRVARSETRTPERPVQWQDWSLDWEATGVGRHSLRAQPTPSATSNPTSHPGTDSVTETTRSRSRTSTSRSP